MNSIHFHLEHPDFLFTSSEDKRKWILSACRMENVKIERLDFIFCTDDDLLEINIKHLNHNYLTDIITFPYKEGNTIAGDIFISVDRIQENSKDLEVDFYDELCRVMIHGVLHLCGYSDKTDFEKAEMRKKEDYYLSLRPF